tara:strand:- start:5427 stop:6362 length:936 start_codon:yes stop_codon:yes gene_type:complete
VRALLVVGAILREPVEITLRFVSWYLDQGVDQIVLCFDDPDDPAIALLKDHDKVRCIPCTRAFWLGIGIRPRKRFTLRQNAAMQHIYDGLPVGWFLNVDGDELVYLQGRTLKQEVSAQPDQVSAILIRPAERIQSPDRPGTIQFRTAMPRWCCNSVYRDLSKAMLKRRGLSGHWIGKSVTRTGLATYRVRQHYLRSAEGDAHVDVILGPENGAYLLHFIDQGYDAWRSKLDWRLSSWGYRGTMRDILLEAINSPTPEHDLRRIYDAIFVFDHARLTTLERAKACLAIDMAQHTQFARHFAAEVEIAQRMVG